MSLSHGADTTRLREIAGQITTCARRADSVGDQGQGMIQLLGHIWEGPDLQTMASSWGSARSLLSEAAAAMDHYARLAIEQADQQDQASDDGGQGGPAAFLPPGWPTSPQPQNPPAQPPTDPGGGDPVRPDEMDRILRDYQREDDEMTTFRFLWKSKVVTKSEAEMLDELNPFELRDLDGLANDAFDEADERFPSDADAKRNDDHNDAFRHAYWNALMTERFGEDWARDFGTAHEGVPGNEPEREAMDLYNNEVGRRIARDNPDASPEELAQLVEDAVRRGEMVVIDENGNLAPSNTVPEGETGHPKPVPDPGVDPDSGHATTERGSF